LAALLSFGQPARGQLARGQPARGADPRTESAREHSAQGDAYYKLEKYGNAIGEYEQAYLAKSDPSFLYNIAQCHRLMGQSAEAIKFYRRFLNDAPNAPNRAVAEKHIRELEEASPRSPVEPPAVAAIPAPVAPPPAATLPTPASPSSSPSSASSALPATASPAVVLSPPPPPSSSGAPAGSSEMAPIGENATAPSPTDSHPIYTRWWFWTAVGVVVVGGIVVAAAARRDPSCPGGYTCN
jgi:tetratricopeptide (TPR) repeat protein